jgi:hypothetical protein
MLQYIPKKVLVASYLQHFSPYFHIKTSSRTLSAMKKKIAYIYSKYIYTLFSYFTRMP